MMYDEMKKRYEARFRNFMHDISEVSLMQPKESFLYRIMDGVPFKDLETAILIVKEEHRILCKNAKK